MPAAYQFTIIKGDHQYTVTVSPSPYTDPERYHDPCDERCDKLFQKEMPEIVKKLRQGLELCKKLH